MLGELGVRPRKSWGQHFLCDANVARKMVAALGPSEQILEIGPGLGALTTLLAETGASVVAIERDPLMVQSLASLSSPSSSSIPPSLSSLSSLPVTVIEADVLDYDIGSVFDGSFVVVANLPYYITSPILERLFALRTRITKMVLTMQTEVADRLLSPPGTKTYGSLSLFAQYHAEIRRLFTIPPTCFYPPPEVQSTVVELIPVPPRLSPAEEATFRKLVRAGFGTRRKTLRNALKPLFSPDQLAALPIDLSRRAETLSLEEFVALAKSLQPQN